MGGPSPVQPISGYPAVAPFNVDQGVGTGTTPAPIGGNTAPVNIPNDPTLVGNQPGTGPTATPAPIGAPDPIYGTGTADTLAPLPSTFAGESTAVPGSYAQAGGLAQQQTASGGAGGTLYTLPNGQTTSNLSAHASMYDPSTGQTTSDPSQFARIQAGINAANGQTSTPTPYTDVKQVSGVDPSVYVQQLANANPNATATQQAGINAVNGGNPVTAGTATNINPVTGIPQLASTDPLAGLPAGSIAASNTPISQSALGGAAPFNPNNTQATDMGGSQVAPTSLSNIAVDQGVGTGTTNTTPSTGTTAASSSPAPSDVLGQLLQGVSGQGAGSSVQNATTQAELAQLANPNPYQSAAVQAQETAGQDTLNQQFGAQQKQLDEYLASRGIAASSFGGGYQGDLAGQQATAEAGLQSNILTNEAASQLAGTGQAISQGQSGATSAQNNSQSWLNQLMGYGQQAFNNDTTTNAANATAQNNYQNLLLQMLLAGYSGGTTA